MLNEKGNVVHVAYAELSIDSKCSEEVMTIFFDRTLFEASSVGLYNLLVEGMLFSAI